MSGSPLDPWAFQNWETSKKNALILGRKLGATSSVIDTDLLEIFYTSSAEIITIAGLRTDVSLPFFAPVLENPTISPDGRIFESICMIDKYTSGSFSQVPYIIGFTKDESAAYFKSKYPQKTISRRDINGYIEKRSICFDSIDEQTLEQLVNGATMVANDSNTLCAIDSLFSEMTGDNWIKKVITVSTYQNQLISVKVCKSHFESFVSNSKRVTC